MFLIPLDQQRSWYRYHHLFADLMHRKLEQAYPQLIPTLHRRASQWFQENAYLDEAVLHALAAPDFDRAANLIERYGMQMVVSSELVTLQRWLDALPEETITARPWLCICHAWARYYVGLREEVEPRLKDAERALQSGPGERVSALNETDKRHIAGNIAALRAYIALQNEELDRVEPLAQRALELLPEEDPARATSAIALAAQQAFGTLPEAGYARATSAIALAETPRQQGDLAASEKAYARAKEIAEQSGNLPMAVSAVAYMAYQQAKQGRLHKAHATLLDALALAVGPDGSQLPAAGLPYVKLGDLMREWDELETARKYLEKGIDLCIQWGHADALVTGYTTLARVQLAQNDLDRARETFRKAERLARQTEVDPWAVCWIDDCRLRLWLAAGDLASAVSWAQTSGLTPNDQLSFVRDLEHVNLARVSLAQGLQQPDGPFLKEALALLARLLQAAEGAGWVSRTLEILVLQSLAFNASGEQQAALAALSRALTIAEPEGYKSVFLDEGRPIAQLLTRLEEQGIESQYARDLLAALAQRTETKLQLTGSTTSSIHIPQHLAVQPPKKLSSVDQPLIDSLTERELQVLRLLDTSLSQQQIAAELHIAVSTVRTHIRNIYSKLDVHRRYEAVQIAKQAGLL
jgi:LuxR family maltose regulon positive regulatory protein